jgi:hypothetical protein
MIDKEDLHQRAVRTRELAVFLSKENDRKVVRALADDLEEAAKPRVERFSI